MGFGLSLRALGRFVFTADEAVYAAWARHAFHGDPWFLTVWPDKPPLFLWTLGATFMALGNRPETAQFLNIAFSTLTIALVGVAARTLWGPRAGMTAAALMALNPFAVSFASTAFTDPMLVCAGMAALLAAVRGRAGWAGVWLGVAVMTKQTGVLYAPLVVSALWLNLVRPRVLWPWLRGVGGLLLVIGPIILWDSRRWATAPSPWDLSVRNYGALALAPVATLPARLHDWRAPLGFLLADGVAWGVVALLLAAGALLAWRTRPAPGAGMAVLLALWSVGFVGLHVGTTVPTWDRYLLPLAPMLALLPAWGIGTIARQAPRVATVAALLLVLTLLRPAVTAAAGGLPVGGDKGAYTGLPAALAWLDDQAATPAQTPYVLYHSRLGWHFQYYLFDANAAGAVDLRWFPSTTYLADNAEKTPHLRKFLLEPDWNAQPDLARRLAMRGMTATVSGRFGRFTLYEIVPGPGAAGRTLCAWCVSRQPPETGGASPASGQTP